MAAQARSATERKSAAGDASAIVDAASTVLRAYKMDTLADVAAAKLARDRQARTVVVVGEVQRGKSSLVNALVGQRDLCPVGVEVTSSTAVSVTVDAALDVDETAELFFPSGTSRTTPVDELAQWVTTDGAHVRDPQVDELPTSAAVGVRTARVSDMTLVDTPGVGGLDVGLAKLATQSAQQACVLVLVCDASSPLTAPEMEFVREASSTVDSVVVVVTKTDKNLRRWREIVSENERLLTREIGRPFPVFGVSSLLASISADLVEPARAARERERYRDVALRTHPTARRCGRSAGGRRRAHLPRRSESVARQDLSRTRRRAGWRQSATRPHR